MAPRKPRRASAQDPTDTPLAQLPTLMLPGAAPIDDRTPTEERRDRELEDILSQLGSDGRMRVYHVGDGKAVYAGEMTLDGFTLDVLLDTFGGGDKSLVIYQGQRKVETVRVSLDPAVPPTSPRTKGLAVRPGQPMPGPGLGEIATVLASMAQMNMQSMQASQQMMTGMVSAMATLMTAKPDKGTDPLELVRTVMELTKRDATSPATELFSVFEKGMNVAQRMGGDGDDGTMAVVKEGLAVVSKIVENTRPVATIPAPTQQVALPRTAPPMPTPSPVVGEEPAPMPAERPWVAVMRPRLKELLVLFGVVSPATAASVIADALTDEQFSDLVADIESGTPDEFVARFQRSFTGPLDIAGVEWLLKLVAEVMAMVEPEDGAPETETESVA